MNVIEMSIQTNYIQLQHNNIDIALKLTLTNNPRNFNLIHNSVENAKQVCILFIHFSYFSSGTLIQMSTITLHNEQNKTKPKKKKKQNVFFQIRKK